MGMNMTMRLPYAMQIGDESLRLNAALTHVYRNRNWVFGGQISGKFKVAANDWHFGDSQQATIWAQREMNRRLSLSGRLTYERISGLEGMDAMIMAPVQTAIPANYGSKVAHRTGCQRGRLSVPRSIRTSGYRMGAASGDRCPWRTNDAEVATHPRHTESVLTHQ